MSVEEENQKIEIKNPVWRGGQADLAIFDSARKVASDEDESEEEEETEKNTEGHMRDEIIRRQRAIYDGEAAVVPRRFDGGDWKNSTAVVPREQMQKMVDALAKENSKRLKCLPKDYRSPEAMEMEKRQEFREMKKQGILPRIASDLRVDLPNLVHPTTLGQKIDEIVQDIELAEARRRETMKRRRRRRRRKRSRAPMLAPLKEAAAAGPTLKVRMV